MNQKKDHIMAPTTAPALKLPTDFQLRSVDDKLGSRPPPGEAPNPLDRSDSSDVPPLGVLSSFQGTFQGKGLNLIFRPNNIPPTQTNFPNPVAGPPIPQAPNENVLEINLTSETLTFSSPLGSVPNRGLQQQNDIFLNGVPYVQSINDGMYFFYTSLCLRMLGVLKISYTLLIYFKSTSCSLFVG